MTALQALAELVAAIDEQGQRVRPTNWPDGAVAFDRLESSMAAARAVLARGDGLVMVPKEVLDRFPEINPSNYDHNDVCALNAWGVELVLSVKEPT